MTIQCPHEKICEEVFVAYGLQYVQPKRLVLYAPSQPEEKTTGYDAAFVSENCRELIIQFKRASKVTNHTIEFHINEFQLQTLQKYPKNSAFYVVGTFPTLAELLSSQRWDTSQTLLDKYIAIPVEKITLSGGSKTAKIRACLQNIR